MTPKRGRFFVCVVAALCSGLLLALGFWQLDRAQQKVDAQNLLEAHEQLPPWQTTDWPCDASVRSEIPWQRAVVLQGVWLSDKTVWLENRPHRGQTGFMAVTPLRLHAPGHACDQKLVLVQRGWAPRHMSDRTHTPSLWSGQSEVSIEGRLAQHISRVYQLGQEAPPPLMSAEPLIRQNVDAAFWLNWLGQAPLPGVLTQTVPQRGDAQDPLLRDWEPPDTGRDTHLGYAAQWFALAALLIALTLWFQAIRPYLLARRHSHAAT